MPPQLKLSELYKIQDNKKSNKFNAFDRILETCHNKIRNTARVGGMSIFYEIPGMMMGYPLYNIAECCEYIVTSLRKSGLLIQILPAPHVGVIYISWNPVEIRRIEAPSVPKAPMALPGPDNGPSGHKKKRLTLF